MTDVLVVMLWQVVLVGAWGLSRRIRRLERSSRPQCSAQLGALRENVVRLRSDVVFDADEQARRSRSMARFAERADAELTALTTRVEQVSQTLLYQVALLEQQLGMDEPAPSTPLTLAEKVDS